MREDLGEHDLSSLRLAVTGAASIPVQLIHDMRDVLGFDTVITGYGLTEACGIATMCRYDDEPETIATTSGRAIDGVEVVCVDADGEEVPAGEPGHVLIRGYNVMSHYFEEPQRTAETIVDGWLHTGDIGVLDERGYLRITDRLKDMFIVGGFNAYPAEIEHALLAHPQVAEVAVIGIPDERLGEVGMAFVVPKGEVSETELIAWARGAHGQLQGAPAGGLPRGPAPQRQHQGDEVPAAGAGRCLRPWSSAAPEASARPSPRPWAGITGCGSPTAATRRRPGRSWTPSSPRAVRPRRCSSRFPTASWIPATSWTPWSSRRAPTSASPTCRRWPPRSCARPWTSRCTGCSRWSSAACPPCARRLAR